MRITPLLPCLVATLLSAVVAVVPAHAAQANDIIVPNGTWSGRCQAGMRPQMMCLPDNASVYDYMDSNGAWSLEGPDRTAAQTAMNRYDVKTDLVVHHHTSPVFSGPGETDVVWQEGSFGRPDSVLGTTWCDNPTDERATAL